MASLLVVAAAVAAALTATTQAFTAPSSLEVRTTSRPNNNNGLRSPFQQSRPPYCPTSRSSSTSLNFGGDSGILGVGAPEIAVTVIVGYFVLGPSDLYKLVKEIGKFIQNFRTLGAEAATAFEGTMENQLELTEIRKAQAELTDAFSFRRSINTDEFNDPFDKTSFAENSAVGAASVVGAGGATAKASDGTQMQMEEGTAPIKKKKRLVRRKKKKVVEEIDVPSEESVVLSEYPDLDMLDVEMPPPPTMDGAGDEAEKLRKERLERLSGGADSEKSGEPDWFKASEEDIASEVLNQPAPVDPALEVYQQQRFNSQLSADDWNSQVMANEDELAPLSMVMKRLAILEEEKTAADKRIEEEYEQRMNNEDKYYLEKRELLMETITDIQEGVYGSNEAEETAVKEGSESNATKFTA